MGHSVTGIIGSCQQLNEFAHRRALPSPVPLIFDLGLLPLRDVELDSFLSLPLTGGSEGFRYLSDQLMAELANAFRSGKVVYFETDYAGSAGMQGAVALENGKVIYGPRVARIGPVNRALSLLGVRVTGPARDEFETVGLHRHRSTADWLGVDDEDADDGG
jgi:hypothetical protein